MIGEDNNIPIVWMFVWINQRETSGYQSMRDFFLGYTEKTVLAF